MSVQPSKLITCCIKRVWENFWSLNCVTHKENGDPSKPYIVKGDCTLKRIVALALALGVVLVPVDAAAVGRVVVAEWQRRSVTLNAIVPIWRQLRAQVHSIVLRLGADVVAVLLQVAVVGRQRPVEWQTAVSEVLFLNLRSFTLLEFLQTNTSHKMSDMQTRERREVLFG